MIRRPPRSTQGVSSAASDVYKRQHQYECYYMRWTDGCFEKIRADLNDVANISTKHLHYPTTRNKVKLSSSALKRDSSKDVVPEKPQVSMVFTLDKMYIPVSYTHLRAHETSLHLVCRLLLEKKKTISHSHINENYNKHQV
eukprot:TRINITY_DN52480_c0_g1_i1.p1 TRINITY_DN52480_c0_g1~~TRINITY_DN52480_c0_g1_i1.p1  ORF type:complete len:141 (-),score=25.34 TRINITY_DN52480_c0_g1_i1:47-469(-)